jgi:hypothetical protein
MGRDSRITLLLQRVINVMDKQQLCMSADMAKNAGTKYIYEYIMQRIQTLKLYSPSQRQDSGYTTASISICELSEEYQDKFKQIYPDIQDPVTDIDFCMFLYQGTVKITTTVNFDTAPKYTLPHVQTVEQTELFMNTIFPESQCQQKPKKPSQD